jgi:predicted TIM-barrel fold metal-dependent hydrolase
MNRKEFIAAASLLPFASSGSAGPKSETAAYRLFDTHQHLYETTRFSDNWGTVPVEGDFGMSKYLKVASEVNIEKAIYIEVAVPPARKHDEAMYAIELCADNSNPTAGAVISYDLYSDDFISYIAQFKKYSSVKGIRAGVRNQQDVSNEKIIKHVRALGEMGMSLDFSASPRWLGAMATLIQNCPDTLFLVNHCANVDPKAFAGKNVPGYPDHSPQQWLTDLRRVAEQKNVACKISGVVTRSSGYLLNAANLGPAIKQCLSVFGPDRVMFASDWPWCLRGIDVKGWVDILKEVVVKEPRDDQEKLFYNNALKFYRI